MPRESWEQFVRSPNVEDRTDTPWPWHPAGAKLKDPHQSVPLNTDSTVDRTLEPITALAMQLGANQIKRPSDEEIMRFITSIEMMNPYEPKRK